MISGPAFLHRFTGSRKLDPFFLGAGLQILAFYASRKQDPYLYLRSISRRGSRIRAPPSGPAIR